MAKRPYYSARCRADSERTGFDLPTLRKLFLAVYQSASTKGLFYQAFGYRTSKNQYVGTLGGDIGASIHLTLRKDHLWPIDGKAVGQYSEEDIFDLCEFLYDHASWPILLSPWFFSGAQDEDGLWHFDEKEGKKVFREACNDILKDYSVGWQLTEDGEIVQLADSGLETLIKAELPEYDPENVGKRVKVAIRKYWSRGSTIEDRRDAVRDLADVLEFLRPKAKKCFLSKKDDGDLFNIANNFAIRHHDGEQQANYSRGIWYSWMFYFYLATIHAAVRVIKESESRGAASESPQALS